MLQGCKILGRTISFTLRYIEIRKHFLKYHSPPCASKSFCMYMCYHILHIVWKWLAGTRGERCSAAQKPRAYAHKMPFLPNKKLMTVIKFSRTNLLNCFVFCASLISILLKEPFALKNSETVYLTIIFSTLGYSDITLIDNFDLIFFYFYFVFEIFGNNSVSIP